MSNLEPSKMKVALPCMLCGMPVLQDADGERVAGEIRAISNFELLLKALERQTDNMAFLLNHASVYGWYERFTRELEEDRAALSQAKSNGGE